ncbi:MAG: Hsp20 family protein [Rhodospirillales bacterium]|nr:Hsp20 family protein [Rhodospirillales bacterium]
MSRTFAFNSPFLLGFDHLERVLDRAAKAAGESYPPYNIEQTAENKLRITLAVAGFTMDDLAVTTEDNQLVVRGRPSEDDKDRIFLHRGIGKRQFQRAFVLAEGINISGAVLDNGLLHIDLERPIVEPEVRTIKIEKAPPKRGEGAQTITVDPSEN